MENSDVKDQLPKLLENFVDNLKNEEVRKKLLALIDDLSKMKRVDFINRYTAISKYVDDICGEHSNVFLFNILSRSLPSVDTLLDQIKDAEVKDWLKTINVKYISKMEGCFPPFLNDWYRVLWTVKVDYTHGNLPFLETTVLKRNQESAFLDVPFSNMVILMNHWLTQMCTTKAYNISEDKEFMAQLQNTKKIIDNAIGLSAKPVKPEIAAKPVKPKNRQ